MPAYPVPAPLDPSTDELWLLTRPAAAIPPQQLLQDEELGPQVTLNVKKIRQCVAEGANLFYTRLSHPTDDPILPMLIKKGQVIAFQVCLESGNDIDFNFRDWSGFTLMHLIAMFPGVLPATAMLHAVVHRLQTRPHDPEVDWNAKDPYGRTFLTIAADRQRLSWFWQEIRDVPFFADQVEPIDVAAAADGDVERDRTRSGRVTWTDWRRFEAEMGEAGSADIVDGTLKRPEGFF